MITHWFSDFINFIVLELRFFNFG